MVSFPVFQSPDALVFPFEFGTKCVDPLVLAVVFAFETIRATIEIVEDYHSGGGAEA